MKKETTKKESLTREEFYKKFKATFDTKSYMALADEGDWKPEFQYVHLFETGVKHQLAYYQYTGRILYWVINPATSAVLNTDGWGEYIIKVRPVVKKNKKGEPVTTQVVIYTKFDGMSENVKFAKTLMAAAKQAAAK